jgi:hypothetical protein
MCSLHDGIEFEKRGIPAAVIVTAPFTETARASSAIAGLPDYRFATIPHGIQRLDVDEVQQIAIALADSVEGMIWSSAG